MFIKNFMPNHPLHINGVHTGLLLLRLTASGLMLSHGWPKLLKLLAGGEIQFADPIGIGPLASLILVVFSEFICSLLLAVGLWTRMAAIPLVITMTVAAFIALGEEPLARKELPLLYLMIYLLLTLTGPGKFSIDALFSSKKLK